MSEHNEKIIFKNMIVNKAINADLKNMFARLYDVFCFLSLSKFNAITSYFIILYHDYLNKRKKYFEKIFNRYSCLGSTSLNVPPTYLFSKTSL